MKLGLRTLAQSTETRVHKLRDTLRILCKHPLTRDRKARTLAWYVTLQVRTRLSYRPVIVPFVEDTKLLIGQNMDSKRADVAVGLFEFQDMGFLLHALRGDSLFVDVGANVGFYSILAGGVVGSPCVALEPVPQTFERLRENLELNGLHEIVRAQNLGVGSQPGTLRFTWTEGANNHVLTRDSEDSSIPVTVTSLDDLLADEEASPTIIKIDVEGWEAEVIRGAAEVLGRSDPMALIIELCDGDRYGFDEDEIDETLRAYGFAPVIYNPLERHLEEIGGRRMGKNTIYVNEFDFFANRIESSKSYSILGQQI